MKKSLIIILSLFVYISLFSQTEQLYITVSEANEAYNQGNFDVALDKYQVIVNQNYKAAELYYNIGNTYFKQQNYAKAILYYERALKLKPNDDDIKYNLEHANKFIKDEFTEVPDFVLDSIYKKLLHSFSSNTWAVISIFCFNLALLTFLIFLFSKTVIRRKLAFFSAIFFVLISMSSFNFSNQMKRYFTNPNEAIIMEISTIKSSPDDAGTDLYILNSGIKVGVKSTNDKWYEVVLPNGKIGWILKDKVEMI